MIDAGFLELVRLGVLPASDPDVQVVAHGRRRHDRAPDPERPGLLPLRDQLRPSPTDGYGDCYPAERLESTLHGEPARPWPPTDTGTGHLWPVLSGERGEYDIADGDCGGAGDAADRDAEA